MTVVVEATSVTLPVAAGTGAKIAGRRRTQATATMDMGNKHTSRLGHRRSSRPGTLRRQGTLDSAWAFRLRRHLRDMGTMGEDRARRTAEAATISTRTMGHRHLGPTPPTVMLMEASEEAGVATRVEVATAEVVVAATAAEEEEGVVAAVEDMAADATTGK
ncbi:XRN 5'-3' exonuclease [Colletotrichum tofieldiae]|nr:XRN 5'-3' exonuclease [Colletotrichum tofieldiae]GKT86822.1 XRN 5'-3' exonuclease [Colletotrichum tofieldiae]